MKTIIAGFKFVENYSTFALHIIHTNAPYDVYARCQFKMHDTDVSTFKRCTTTSFSNVYRNKHNFNKVEVYPLPERFHYYRIYDTKTINSILNDLALECKIFQISKILKYDRTICKKYSEFPITFLQKSKSKLFTDPQSSHEISNIDIFYENETETKTIQAEYQEYETIYRHIDNKIFKVKKCIPKIYYETADLYGNHAYQVFIVNTETGDEFSFLAHYVILS